MTPLDQLMGSAVAPDDVPTTDAPILVHGTERLETGVKIVDAVVPVIRGGSVDVLGPAGLGQLVLIVEIAVKTGALVVAAGLDHVFAELVADDVLGDRALVISGGPKAAAAAADRAARMLAGAAHDVLLVLDPPTWAAGSARPGAVRGGRGSVTSFRFAPHARDGDPTEPLGDADASLVFATSRFVEGRFPAVDVSASRSKLIEWDAIDTVTAATARAAREVISKADRVSDYLAQHLSVSEPFTGVPGEHIPARAATEGLAALLR